jgi:hypothetical protein
MCGWLVNRDIGMGLSATRRDELEDKTALDVWGLSSRAKFHKQYRRNGIPRARIRASKYRVMSQSSLRPSCSIMSEKT